MDISARRPMARTLIEGVLSAIFRVSGAYAVKRGGGVAAAAADSINASMSLKVWT